MKSHINGNRIVRGRVSINPFLERGARKVNSTMSIPACVVEDMGKVFQIGKEQYKLYKETRFVIGVADVLNTTKQTNQLKLPKDSEQ